MRMPDLTILVRMAHPLRSIPMLATLALAAVAPAAAAEEAPLPYELTDGADTGLAPGIEEPPARYLQNNELDENILLPPARPQDDNPDRKWSRE